MERPFVIHIHSGQGFYHYDLMIDDGQVLATWQFALPPAEVDKTELSAVKLPDHRRHYLTYEGPVSKGRGEVKFYDRGQCEVVAQLADRMEIIFRGNCLQGRFELIRRDRELWTFRRVGDV